MADQRELRATSDQTFALIERVRTIEGEKTLVEIGSPEFVDLAQEVEQLCRVLFRWSQFQVQLADEARMAKQRGDIPPLTLRSIEPRPLDRILAEWREAQIRLEIARPGTPEAEQCADDIERLREEYHATTDAKLAEDEVEPLSRR